MKEQTWIGHWWQPKNENQKIAGTLNYQPNNEITLNLIGYFDIHAGEQIEYIHGITNNGKKITLYNSFCRRQSNSSNGFKTQSLLINFLLIGSHIIDFSLFEFSVQFFNTNYWLHLENGILFGNNPNFKTEVSPFKEYNVELDEFNIKLQLSHNVKNEYDAQQVRIKQEETFFFQFNDSISLEKTIECLVYLRNLLAFCQQIPVIFRKILLSINNSNSDIEFVFIDKHSKYNYLDGVKKLPPPLIEGHIFQENFSKIVTNWFENKNQLDYQIENYMDLYHNDAFASDKYLTHVRLLESLHKNFINSTRVHQVVRYNYILTLYKHVLNDRIFIDDNDEWCSKVKNYRNDLTHNNRINKARALKFKDLSKITHETNLLIISFLLNKVFKYDLANTGNFIFNCFRFSVFNSNNHE